MKSPNPRTNTLTSRPYETKFAKAQPNDLGIKAVSVNHQRRVIVDDISYPEGPLWDHGHLYFTDYQTSRVYRCNQDHSLTTIWAKPSTGPSSIARFRDGFLVACYDSNQLAYISENGETREIFDAKQSAIPFEGPNDLASDGHGGLYISMSGPFEQHAKPNSCVYHFSPSGALRLVASGLHYANGLVIHPQTNQLIVSEHLSCKLTAFEILPDFNLSPPRLFAHTKPQPGHDPMSGIDGLKLTPSRDALMGAFYGQGRLVMLNLHGRIAGTIELPFNYPTNCTPTPDGRIMVSGFSQQNSEPPRGQIVEIPQHHLS